MDSPASPPESEAAGWRDKLPLWLALGAGLLILVWLIPPGTLPFPPGSRFSDSTLAHWPAAWFLHDAVWTHQSWPLWNPDKMLGQPFSANPLNKVYYPPQWLALLLPATAHLNVMIALHGVLAIWGGWRLGRQRGYSAALSAALGLAWALLPKTLAHLGAGHLDIFYALAWLPWACEAWIRLGQSPGWQRAAQTGLISGMLALADMRMAFFGLPFAVGWALIARIGGGTESWAGRRSPLWAILAPAGLATLITGLLLVVYLAPLAVLSPYLTRSLITAAEAGEGALSLANLAGLLIPDLLGSHETFIYLPGLLILLAGIALGRWREAHAERLYFAAVALVLGLWAFGPNGPIFTPLANALPLATWFRGPGRAWLFVSWALLLLASDAAHSVQGKPLNRAEALAAMATAMIGLAGLGLIFIVPAELRLATGGSFGALVLGAGGLWISGQRGQSERRRLSGWGVAGASTLVVVGIIGAGRIDGKTIAETEASDLALISVLHGCGPVYSPSYDLVGAWATRMRIQTLHGVNPLQIRAAYELIGQASGNPFDGYSVVVPAFPVDAPEGSSVETVLANVEPDYDLLWRLNIQRITSAFPLSVETGIPVRQIEGRLVYSSDRGIGPLSNLEYPLPVPCGQAPNVLADGYTGETYDLGQGHLVFSQAYVPGWRAWYSGQWRPVLSSPDGLIMLYPQGDNVYLRLIYRPTAEFIGMGVSGVTLIMAIIVSFIKPRKVD